MLELKDLNTTKTYWFSAVYFNGAGTNRFFSSISSQPPVEVKIVYKAGDSYIGLLDVLTGKRISHPRYYSLSTYQSWGDQYFGNYLYLTKEEATFSYNKSLDLERERLHESLKRKERQLEKAYID